LQKIPDVLGLELDVALPILTQCNCKFSITETLSPKSSKKDGECRIIHLKKTNEIIELLVSFF